MYNFIGRILSLTSSISLPSQSNDGSREQGGGHTSKHWHGQREGRGFVELQMACFPLSLGWPGNNLQHNNWLGS